jgi:hypothetical protein
MASPQNIYSNSDTIYIPTKDAVTIFAGYHDWTGHHISPARDSLLKANLTPGHFLGTSRTIQKIEPRPIKSSGEDWIFWGILLGFLLLTISKFFYEKRLRLLVSAIFSRPAASQLLREGGILRHQSFIPLVSIYMVSVTLFIYTLLQYFNPGHESLIEELETYGIILGAFLGYFFVKIFLIRMSGIIFKNENISSEYIQNIFIYNLFLGISILPLLLLIEYSYSRVFIYITLTVSALILSNRFIRGLIIGMTDTKFSLFHLFLYLCTLEILPLIFIAKFFDKYFFS